MLTLLLYERICVIYSGAAKRRSFLHPGRAVHSGYPVNIDEIKALIRERSGNHGIIVSDHNYGAISSVADNLFVIADGYTSPVRSREDLVLRGYLRAED